MASTLTTRGLFRPITNNTMRSLTTMLRATKLSPSPATSTITTSTAISRTFTTTPSLPKKATKTPAKGTAGKGGKGGAAGGPHKQDNSAAARRARREMANKKLDPKTANLMKFIYAGSQARAPLRMARNRHLRHWTIHRAWLLFRRQRMEARDREMMRLRASMEHACETLRNMAGPGTQPVGYLYRKATEKRGLWSQEAIPIEYARPLVETPGNRPWNHEWKRPEAKSF